MINKIYKKRLISRIFNLLDLIENKRNQSVVNEIRGLLHNLKDMINEE